MAGNGRIEIEKIVKERLEAEGRTVKWLCEKLGWQRPKWYRFQLNGYIDVHDLYAICAVLNHDFFQYFSI
jgi:hypothetical protein